MAALTALGEDPQVHQRGCGPVPRGRKEGRRKRRLGREFAWATRLACQKLVMAVFTEDLKSRLSGGEFKTWRGSGRE